MLISPSNISGIYICINNNYLNTILTPPCNPPSNTPFPLPPARTCALRTKSSASTHLKISDSVID